MKVFFPYVFASEDLIARTCPGNLRRAFTEVGVPKKQAIQQSFAFKRYKSSRYSARVNNLKLLKIDLSSFWTAVKSFCLLD